MIRLNKLTQLLAGAALVLAPTLAEAVLVEFDPSASVVNLGDSFDVDVVVSDIGLFDALTAFDIDVTYDAAIVDATAVTFGTEVGGGFPFSLQFSSVLLPGHIDASETFLLPAVILAGQPDSFVIATLTFEALAPGTSALSLTSPGLFAVENILTSSIEGFSPTAEGSVQVIPAPATLLLFGVGLGGLAARRRRLLS